MASLVRTLIGSDSNSAIIAWTLNNSRPTVDRVVDRAAHVQLDAGLNQFLDDVAGVRQG
jgi:hypothetical protein